MKITATVETTRTLTYSKRNATAASKLVKVYQSWGFEVTEETEGFCKLEKKETEFFNN